MKRFRIFLTLSIVGTLVLYAAQATAQTDTTFTYQGRLDQNGQPVNASVDLDFALFDAAVGGNQIDAEIMFNSVPINDGLFTVDLDFGAAAFDNSNRWLRIKVNGTTLNPRQPVSRSPYAIQTRGLFVDEMQNVGIGTNFPVNALHVAADTPALRLENNIDPTSPLLIENSGIAQMRLNKFTSTGTSLIDINPMPLDGTGTANIRFFRLTNTTGIKGAIFHSGNNSTATSAVIGVGGNPSVFQLDGGNFGIGTQSPANLLSVAGNADFTGNVGIGISSPQAKLDVRGDIRLGNFGELFAPGGEEKLRIVRGVIGPLGTISAGTGFTVIHQGTGQYRITFSPGFAFTPVITATPELTSAVSPFVVAMTLDTTVGSATVFCVSPNSGNFLNTRVHFIAIGPR